MYYDNSAPEFADVVRHYVLLLAAEDGPYDHSALLFLRSLACADVAERHTGLTDTWPSWSHFRQRMAKESFTVRMHQTPHHKDDALLDITVIGDSSEASLLGWALEAETPQGRRRARIHPGTHSTQGGPFKPIWGATISGTFPDTAVSLVSPAGDLWGLSGAAASAGESEIVISLPDMHQSVHDVQHLSQIISHLAIEEFGIFELLALCGRQRITDKAIEDVQTLLCQRGLTTHPKLTKTPRSYLVMWVNGLIADIFTSVLNPTESGDKLLEMGIGIDLLWDAHNYVDMLNYLAKISGDTRPNPDYDWPLEELLDAEFLTMDVWNYASAGDHWGQGYGFDFPTPVAVLDREMDWLENFGHAAAIIDWITEPIDPSYGAARDHHDTGVLAHVWANGLFTVNPSGDWVQFISEDGLKIEFTSEGKYVFSPAAWFTELDATNPNLVVTKEDITILTPDLDLEATILDALAPGKA